MGIFLKKRGDGYDPRWHGSWMVDGVRKTVSLNLWHGTPPSPGEKEGDAVFERSRGEAERLFKEARDGKKSVEEELVIAQKVHAARYGRKVRPVKLADLASKWDALPGRDSVTDARRARVHAVLGRFVAFMAENYPRVTECGGLTAEHFRTFFEDVEKRGIPRKRKQGQVSTPKERRVSARTWNDVLEILRGVLRRVGGQGEGFQDYLSKLPYRDEKTVHRRPFTGAELEAIFTAAAEFDPELYPVIVAAACTALRRGDVAQLRWADVDMEAGFVTVKTSKTGEFVEIPIFPPFMAVLANADARRHTGVPFVFPSIAKTYRESPYSLDHRLRKVLAVAGFVTPDKVDAGKYPAPATPGEAVEKVNAGMVAGRWSEARRQKGLAILQRHLNGETGKAIAAAMGIARGAVSAYLHEMENVGRIALVSPSLPEAPRKATLAEIREDEPRRNRGSLCGWHSFRTTFCSLALANGVPMELLTRITGHRTAEIVEKYYNQSKREQTRRELGAAMPKAIAGAVAASMPMPSAKIGDFEAVPQEVAKVARMLVNADTETLAKVAELLKKGGEK